MFNIIFCCNFKKTFYLNNKHTWHLFTAFAMAVDWIGFSYAAAIAFGGFMGYKRKGRKFTLDNLKYLLCQKAQPDIIS